MNNKQINPFANSSINAALLDKALDDLAEKKWSCVSGLLPREFVDALAQECQSLYDEGSFKAAGIGPQGQQSLQPQIRGDFIHWLQEPLSPLQTDFLQFLENLRQTLNGSLFLNLKRVEAHFAQYPPGGAYARHIDNPRRQGHRLITFILYLNPQWQSEHGGELALYDPENENQVLNTIAPRHGDFVLFCSDVFPHEVKKSSAWRRSLTGWFRNDAL